MVRTQLQELQWTKIEGVLASLRGAGRSPKDDRKFHRGGTACRRYRHRDAEVAPFGHGHGHGHGH